MPATLILLPGLDGTGELFAPFVTVSPPGVTTIPVAYPTESYSYDELEALVQEKLTDNCVLLGESFSGPLAIRLARDPRVRALILCNSFASALRSSWLRYFAIAPLFGFGPPRFVLRWSLLGKRVQPSFVEKVQEVIRRVPAKVLARRVRQVLSCNEGGTLAGLAKPVLYLRGIADALVTDRSWREVKSLNPNIRVAKLGGPHMLLQVEPKPCWKVILPILQEPAVG